MSNKKKKIQNMKKVEAKHRLYKLERIFSQQMDLKSALDSKDFLLNTFRIKFFI